MASYIALLKFTEHGAENVKDTCKRAADYRASAQKAGIQVKEQYWCMGAYDGVIVFDAPDDETATAGMMSLSSAHNLTTQTMRSFSAAEMGKILSKVS